MSLLDKQATVLPKFGKNEPDWINTNPLAVVKETAGYTAIFRTMGVIGGSMSTGVHAGPYNARNANMPEYSSLQFMARLCGSEGFNFSWGGTGAYNWCARFIDKTDAQYTILSQVVDDFLTNPCQMYLIQLGNNDLSLHNNRIMYSTESWNELPIAIKNIITELGHTESDWNNATQEQRLEWIGYDLGVISDVDGVLSNDGTIRTFANTFYGNMGRILYEIRKIQPRAYVFLSTFLKDYGYGENPNPPAEFDYNAAMRNIVERYNDQSTRLANDGLSYYLVDIYTYGYNYSYFRTGIHNGTVRGSHLVATGYLLWAYQYCTYIDWLIKNDMDSFNDVAFVGLIKIEENLTGVTSSPTFNYLERGANLDITLSYSGTISILVEKIVDGTYREDITSTAWNPLTNKVTVNNLDCDIVITASAS